MVRNRIIALALTGALVLGGIGWKATLASEAAYEQDAHSGPIGTWSAYQPADTLAASAQVNHLPAYNAYAQVYGSPTPAAAPAYAPVYASAVPAAAPASEMKNPDLGIMLPQGLSEAELPAGLRDYVRR
jgi:hypothetical protein